MNLPLCWMAILFALGHAVHATPLVTAGKPAELSIRVVGDGALRVTLKPIEFQPELPANPALLERADAPVLLLQELSDAKEITAGGLKISVKPDPLTVRVSSAEGVLIQELAFQADDSIALMPPCSSTAAADSTPWSRIGNRMPTAHEILSPCLPARVAGDFGSRARGEGSISRSRTPESSFPLKRRIPRPCAKLSPTSNCNSAKASRRWTFVPGLLDAFIFDAREPTAFMKNLATLSGRAVMPPKWSLGYMQSHRTLEDDAQMLKIVDTFREKHIPLDAVIYLGTGFTPRGWNKPQPSFEFNPEVFKRDPAAFIADVHQRHAKVVLHMVPWDRDRIPLLDDAHLGSYWKEHEDLVKAGVDGWWPDEGDWFDLYERMKRHQLYYDGPLSTQPDRRPWSLHRNGYLGIARWGGWVWSGDTQSTWKSLEAQIAVGINHSLSLSPYWGSDIAGFFSTPELTGELYARWFQFAAFTPSFRAHGRTWWTRLPWGWGLDSVGPVEDKEPPKLSELDNPAIEPIAKKYAELRYQLLTYNYTLAWQARETGLPFMRALWLHYPTDEKAHGIGNEYLWGPDLLIAPVFEKGATSREVYLPQGQWYDFWSGELHEGGRTIRRSVDLATMPIFVKAGTILPLDPIRQYTGEETKEPLTIRIYRGANGSAQIYHDDGSSNGYLEGESAVKSLTWDDGAEKLTIEPNVSPGHRLKQPQKLRIELMPGGNTKEIDYPGETIAVEFK
jgi:alpha-glucosidase (family GH31 glycosyl hydrolase)